MHLNVPFFSINSLKCLLTFKVCMLHCWPHNEWKPSNLQTLSQGSCTFHVFSTLLLWTFFSFGFTIYNLSGTNTTPISSCTNEKFSTEMTHMLLNMFPKLWRNPDKRRTCIEHQCDTGTQTVAELLIKQDVESDSLQHHTANTKPSTVHWRLYSCLPKQETESRFSHMTSCPPCPTQTHWLKT